MNNRVNHTGVVYRTLSIDLILSNYNNPVIKWFLSNTSGLDSLYADQMKVTIMFESNNQYRIKYILKDSAMYCDLVVWTTFPYVETSNYFEIEDMIKLLMMHFFNMDLDEVSYYGYYMGLVYNDLLMDTLKTGI